MAVVLEAYVNGVSTRKVDRLVEQLGIAGMSKDRVSALCRALDEQVTVFRERPLEGSYPYLWLDAKHLKVRSGHDSGVREVIGLDLGEVWSEAFWVEFLRSLRARGLQGVRLSRSLKVCRLLEDAEADLLAFYAFPSEHWPKLRSTNPLERVNREIGGRSDVIGIFPNDASAIRLAGALLIEQNDEWLVCRRYFSAESMALLDAMKTEDPHTHREK